MVLRLPPRSEHRRGRCWNNGTGLGIREVEWCARAKEWGLLLPFGIPHGLSIMCGTKLINSGHDGWPIEAEVVIAPVQADHHRQRDHLMIDSNRNEFLAETGDEKKVNQKLTLDYSDLRNLQWRWQHFGRWQCPPCSGGWRQQGAADCQ